MRILILGLFSFMNLQLSVFASASLSLKDSLPNANHQLSENEFLTRYGKDDSSRALIHFYFSKRKGAKKLMFIPGAIGISVAVPLVAAYNQGSDSPSGIADVLLIELISLAAMTGIIFSLTGGSRLIIFTRKLLLDRLLRYEKDGFIPMHISRSRLLRDSLNGYHR